MADGTLYPEDQSWETVINHVYIASNYLSATAAGDQWAKVLDEIKRVSASLTEKVHEVGLQWRGPGFQAFAGHMKKLTDAIDQLAKEHEPISRCLTDAGGHLREAYGQVTVPEVVQAEAESKKKAFLSTGEAGEIAKGAIKAALQRDPYNFPDDRADAYLKANGYVPEDAYRILVTRYNEVLGKMPQGKRVTVPGVANTAGRGGTGKGTDSAGTGKTGTGTTGSAALNPSIGTGTSPLGSTEIPPMAPTVPTFTDPALTDPALTAGSTDLPPFTSSNIDPATGKPFSALASGGHLGGAHAGGGASGVGLPKVGGGPGVPTAPSLAGEGSAGAGAAGSRLAGAGTAGSGANAANAVGVTPTGAGGTGVGGDTGKHLTQLVEDDPTIFAPVDKKYSSHVLDV